MDCLYVEALFHLLCYKHRAAWMQHLELELYLRERAADHVDRRDGKRQQV